MLISGLSTPHKVCLAEDALKSSAIVSLKHHGVGVPKHVEEEEPECCVGRPDKQCEGATDQEM